MGLLNSYNKELKQCTMLPEDLNSFINSACSMMGAMELPLINTREELKALGLWRQAVKYNGNLLLDEVDRVINFADEATDDTTFSMHISDISTFQKYYAPDRLNVVERVYIAHEVGLLAEELLVACTSALNNVGLKSPVGCKLASSARRVASLSQQLLVALRDSPEVRRLPMRWKSAREDIRNILYELLDRI